MKNPNEKSVSKYTNLDPKTASALAYIVPTVTGIVFFVLEKEDKYVRFHAFQSIVFGIVVYIAMRLAGLFGFLGISWLLREVVSVVGFVFYLLLMWKAYQGETYKLPFLGDIAKKQAEK